MDKTYNAEGHPLVRERKTLVSAVPAMAAGEPLLTEHTVNRDVRGNISENWTLDRSGNLISWSKTPDCVRDARNISVDGELLQSMDHAGIITCYAHNYLKEGDSIQETDGRGNVSVTRSDLNGQTVSAEDAAGNVTIHQYDVVTGLLVKTMQPDSTFSEYSYDVRGRKTAQYGTAKQPLLFEYDEAGRMTALTTFRVPGTVVAANPSDRADGDRTEWNYGSVSGLLLKKTYADGSHEDYTYDDLGQLILTTNPDGVTIERSYVPLTGELAAITYSDETQNIAYAYNHLGQISSVTDALGTRTFSYNQYGEKESENTSGLYTSVLTWKHDALGRSSGYAFSYNGAPVQDITLAYDDAGRLYTALPEAEEVPFTWGYDPASGLLSSLDYPNPLKKLVTWHLRLNLITKLDYWRPNSTNSPVKHEYDYDVLGRVIRKRDYWNTPNPGRRHSYTYNDRGELTGDAMAPGASLSYAYDNIGNRENVVDQGQKTYRSNVLNQYTDITQSQVSFMPAYDANGNQTRLKSSTGDWTVIYNAENQPITFTHNDEQTSVTCVYDYMGRRVEKAVYNNGIVQKKLRYVYNGYLQIAELDATKEEEELRASLVKTYFWDPSETVATRVLTMGLWNGDGSYKETIYLTHDIQKNVTAAFGILGGRRALWEYGPYGNIINSSGNIDGINLFLYSNEYHDDELALIYYNYRYLNPLDGRWLSRDMAGERNLKNLYMFLPTGIDVHGLWFVVGDKVNKNKKSFGGTIFLDGKGGIDKTALGVTASGPWREFALEHEEEHIQQVQQDAANYIYYKPYFRLYKIEKGSLVKKNGDFVCSWAYYDISKLKKEQNKINENLEFWRQDTRIWYTSNKEQKDKEMGPTVREMNKVDKAKGGKKKARKEALQNQIKIYENISDSDTKVNIIWEAYMKQYKKEQEKLKNAQGGEEAFWKWYNEAHVHPDLSNTINGK